MCCAKLSSYNSISISWYGQLETLKELRLQQLHLHLYSEWARWKQWSLIDHSFYLFTMPSTRWVKSQKSSHKEGGKLWNWFFWFMQVPNQNVDCIRSKYISATKKGTRGGPWTPLEGPKIYFRRSWNLPDYSIISLKVETSFSQYQDFHLS